MNAEDLLAHYERISDAPSAIERLRRFVLDLAVHGKLVLQDPDEEPVPAQLIREELDWKQPTGRTGADLGPVTFAEVPLVIPTGWKWVRLFQLCVRDAPIVYGILQPGPDTRPNGVPYVRPSEIENGHIVLADIRHTTQDIAKQYSRASIKTGDLIFTIVGTIGAIAMVPDALDGGNITQSSCRLRVDDRLIHRQFLVQALQSTCVGEQIDRMKLGTAVPRLNIAHVRAIAIPVPPLSEQGRIVAKVDELMTLCDQLEKARVEREARRDKMTAASLARLNTPNPETFRNDARFALDNLQALTTRPDQISQLRRAILRLALEGKLVSQNTAHKPAKDLLGLVDLGRDRLLRSGYPNPDEARAQTKKQSEQVVPANLKVLPKGWSWATLMQCSLLVVDCKNKTAPYSREGIRLVRTTNVRNGRLNQIDQKYVDQRTYEIWSARGSSSVCASF